MQIRIIGPFAQIMTMAALPLKGSLKDEQLQILKHGAVAVQGAKVVAVASFDHLRRLYPAATIEHVTAASTLIPGFIDCHTHICYAGNRAKDYAMRTAGKSYLEIAQAGGGIWETVQHCRLATEQELTEGVVQRATQSLTNGTTTIEVKSGYGLNTKSELKMLRAIKEANRHIQADLVSTCLAAHTLPRDFKGSSEDYLNQLVVQLLPMIEKEKLCKRFDIFIEQSAFNPVEARDFLKKVQLRGFEITIHADQFTPGGSQVAVMLGAQSADHLEHSSEKDIRLIAQSDTIAVCLPGASLGLGIPFSPARKLLDAGAALAIASDWNPGSAPMGQLLTQAAILGAFEKLSLAETISALTYRAAHALNLSDRGKIANGQLADMQAYPTSDYREILYYQGSMKPSTVWKNGKSIS
ncbi:imidazolonepropionase [Olivibacter sp. CPCC 100613]|uniref:imidazolonepropionase n=1 Tax=Olivibacter sp. CPCC 100613 TaxID=3079931 RepID=UPI002FFB1F87